MKKIIVDKKYDGKNLNTFLFDSFNGLKSSTFFKALRKKDIRINDIKINENCLLKQGDEITLFINDEFLYKTFDFDIIYEDENILIINKPKELEVVSQNTNDVTLTTSLQEKYNSRDFPAPCHRLDRNTSGLVLFAKNQESLDILLDKFKNKEIEKIYRCTVLGIPNKAQKTLTSYLFKDNKKSLVYISDTPQKGYQKIITSYKVISSDKEKNISILEVTLHTGKTHQIRAHLAHIGYPILGDRKIW